MSLFHDLVHVPNELRTADFVIRAIRETDAELDYEALMESREFLRTWEGGTWPEDDFTLEDNREDMRTMEQRHASKDSFGFTVMNQTETQCLGCVYIFPTDAKMFARSEMIAMDGIEWSDYGAVVYFWIRKARLADALDRKVLEALSRWLTQDWGFDKHLFITNELFKQQVAMIKETDLPLCFRFSDPTANGEFLAFGVNNSKQPRGLGPA